MTTKNKIENLTFFNSVNKTKEILKSMSQEVSLTTNLEVIKPLHTITGTTWDISTNGYNAKTTLSANKSIDLTIEDGESGFLYVTGFGYSLTIGGKTINIGVLPMLIGVRKMGDIIVVMNKEISSISDIPIIGNYLSFTGSNITTTNRVVTANTATWTNNNGIDTAVLPANTEGRIWYLHSTSTDKEAAIGFTDGSVAVGYNNTAFKAGVWRNFDGTASNIVKIENGAIAVVMSNFFPVVGRFYCVYRNASGNVYFQESTDEITWTTKYTFPLTNTSALRAVCCISSAGRLSTPKRSY